ncbi:hypothetical protein FHW69_001542 [Luteibacter sp. Sphag1AF]|uniref:hypothetical protein n=1 Tax=Luteibacter sp. Sphag1AF TaxID=2587031 RepID=UPI00161C6022|nr:hypothetical protein [Luteibacter sp. Sphag1AF]MBB3226941.1 hypothetical protein [Luteibacter sp. Sphag1AF]
MARSVLKWVAAGLLVASGAACSHDENDKAAETPAVPPAAAAATAPANVPAVAADAEAAPIPVVADEKAAVQRVEASIEKNHLTTLKPECLSYIPYSAGTGFIVDVHERHDDTCGGDPGVSPRVFSFQVDSASGRLQTDATDPAEGLFHAID